MCTKAKAKIDAATNAAQEAASAAQDSLSATQECLNAAAHDAAHTAMDAAEKLKNTVKDYFPTGKSTKETHHHMHDMFHMEMPKKMPEKMPDKSYLISFFAMPYMAIMIALIVVLFSALIFMRRRQIMKFQPIRRLREWMMTKQIGNTTVLICGPVDSGKTLLCQTLSGGTFQPTQTSMGETMNTFKIHDKLLTDAKKDKLQNVDLLVCQDNIHSHEFKMDKFMTRFGGLIILTDASSSDSINHGAKTLFSLMEKKFDKNIPVLFCLNKTDLSESNTMNTIRQKILGELNKLKDKQTIMENFGKSGDTTTASIGKSGERLTWDNLGLTVSFGQISAKQGNVTDVLDFLESIQH